MKKVHDAKYNKNKSESKGGKLKNPISKGKVQHSMSKKSNSNSGQVCFYCKKLCSKGHKK